jgi:DNA polymerase delta subunit 1
MAMKRAADQESLLKKSKKTDFEAILESEEINYENSWSREPSPVKENLEFHCIEIDEVVLPQNIKFDNPYSISEVVALRAYGVTMDGTSVLATVYGFLPYFYVPAPKGFNESFKISYLQALDASVKSGMGYKKANSGPVVLDLEMVQKSNIYGYHGSSKALFLKIIVRLPSFIAACKRILREGIVVNGLGNVSCQNSFESNIPFTLRFMIDMAIQGGSWISIKKEKYYESNVNNSTCNIQLDVW